MKSLLLPMTVIALAIATAGCPNTTPNGTCQSDSDCSDGKACCAGACTDVSADTANCGACGNACSTAHGTATCSAGTCGITCDATHGNCDNDAKNGCEVDLSTDRKHCGSCGTVCAADNADGACNAGVCTTGACNDGYSDCDGQKDNGCEIQTWTDEANCGVCGRACSLENAEPVCAVGVCQVASCNDGFDNCNDNPSDGCEANVRNDPLHCGDCATECAMGEGCFGGHCRAMNLVGFGGAPTTNDDPVDSVWTFDPVAKKFTPVVTAAGADGSPEARLFPIVAWDSTTSRLIVTSGQTATTEDDAVWALDFTQDPPTWSKFEASASSPGDRTFPCFAPDPENRRLFLFGGTSDGTAHTDLWKLDLATGAWTQLHDDTQTPAPAALQGESCAYVADQHTFLLFGGLDQDANRSSDLWTFDVEAASPTWVKQATATAPEGRAFAQFFDGLSPLPMFGGMWIDITGPNFMFPTDVQRLSLDPMADWTVESEDGAPGLPEGRIGHTVAVMKGKGYLFGGASVDGFGNETDYDDVWEYDPEAKTWTQLVASGAENAPPGKAGAVMVAPR